MGEVRTAIFNAFRGWPIKARQLTCLLEVAKLLYQTSNELSAVIRSPKDVTDRMADMRCLTQEEFRRYFLAQIMAFLLKG